MESAGADLRPIGRALGNAVRRGNVALLNGFGNGVATTSSPTPTSRR
jgi:carboxylate-amine ligase